MLDLWHLRSSKTYGERLTTTINSSTQGPSWRFSDCSSLHFAVFVLAPYDALQIMSAPNESLHQTNKNIAPVVNLRFDWGGGGARAGNLDLSRNTEGRKGLKRLLSRGPSEPRDSEGVQIVDWDGYREIDRDEVTRGKLKGKPREKIVDVAKMLKVANSGASS